MQRPAAVTIFQILTRKTDAFCRFYVSAKGHGGLAKHLDITQVLRKPNFWDLEHIFRGSSSGLLLALFEATGVALPLLRAVLSLAALWLPRAKIRDACLALLEGCVAKWCLAQIFTGGLMMIVVAVRVRSDALEVTGRDVFAVGAGQESFICSIIVGSFAVNGIRALSDAALPAAAAPPAKAPRRPRMAAARAAAHFVVFCVYVRSLCHPFVTFTYRGASTMFMTTPVKGGGLWDGVVLVPDVISDFYKAMPDDELDITNLMVVLFVWSCVVVPPFATLALLLALAKRSARDASERSASMSYLAIASILNVASSISDIIDIYLEDIWDVNTDKLEAHDYGGYWRLELLTALVPLAVLGFLPLLPRTREAAATKEDGWFAPWKDAGHGRTAAFLFVAFWVLGDVYVFVYSIETA